ncbi:MAG: hypothetical protein MJ236_07285 [Clostridia bacterium]|nr:hypothetical protein [Clostridia bacterium]
MSKETIKSLMQEMEYNYEFIYHSYEANGRLMRSQDMMAKLYETFLKDIETNNRKSPIFTQHIEKIENYQNEKKTILKPYIETEPNQIVVDFIASMTDEYFRDIYEYMFGMSFTSYFDD